MFQGIPAMMVSGGGAVSAPSGWTQRASDNFDSGTANTNLNTNPSWTARQGTIWYHLGGYVQNNSAVDNFYYWNAYSFNASQYSQFTLVAGSGAVVVGPACRIQTGTVSAYFFLITATIAKLVRYNSGTGTDIVSTAKAYVAGNKLKLEVTGTGSATRLNAYEDTGSGWVAVWSNQDPGGTYIDGGSPGLFGFGGTVGFFMDDWAGGDQ
jgi:hypothetical protein